MSLLCVGAWQEVIERLATEHGDTINCSLFCQVLSSLGVTSTEVRSLCEFLGQDEAGNISIHRFGQWLMEDDEDSKALYSVSCSA